MTLPKGWEIPTTNSKKQEKLFNEDEVWKLVTKSITRVIYDCISIHEARGLNEIDIGWLRDYTDAIAINFPRIQE